VRGDHEAIHLNTPDGIATQTLSCVSMEESSIGVAFPDGLPLATLAPDRRSLFDGQVETVLAHPAHLQFNRRESTILF